MTLQRDKKDYLMYLRDIFNDKAPQVFITDNDHIFVEDIAQVFNRALQLLAMTVFCLCWSWKVKG